MLNGIELHPLGSSSAGYVAQRLGSNAHSAFVLKINNHQAIIDAGEGFQKAFFKNGHNFNKIDFICITHLHPDHFIGLIGFLSSIGMQGRKKDLTLIVPKGTDKILDSFFENAGFHMNYKLHFNIIPEEEKACVWESRNLKVSSIPLAHRIPCYGFLFEEKVTQPKFIKAKAKHLPERAFGHFSRQENYTDEQGKNYLWEDYGFLPPPLRYLHLTDTLFLPKWAAELPPVEMIYHESTFLATHENKAKRTYHSTAEEAGKFAQINQAHTLVLGHFSGRYPNLNHFKEEAEKVFPRVFNALENSCIYLRPQYDGYDGTERQLTIGQEF